MIEGIPRISVMIIAYKQETIISKTLDSLVEQKDFLYEICVSDDCSPDNTWQVLLAYQNRYPELIKIRRNESNVGIFENVELVYDMATGDIVNIMAGDDEAGKGWFRNVVDYLIRENIDYKNERFCIYGDYKMLYLNGDYRVSHNNAVTKKPDALRLALRGLLYNRGACFSINSLKEFDRVAKGRSHIFEHVQYLQVQLHTDKSYYIPQIANVYHCGVGVSNNISEATRIERLQIWPYTVNYLKSKGVRIHRVDDNYGKYHDALFEDFKLKPSMRGFFKVLWYYAASRDLSFLFMGDDLRRIVFAIRRRLPHKKPIILD